MSATLRQIRSEEEFEELLASSPKPLLVDLGASWCGPCQQLTPILEDFAASQDAIEVVTVDTDKTPSLSWRLGGNGVPRMFLFDRGVCQLYARGVRDRAWLEEVVGGYPALGIRVPDGPPLLPRIPPRSIVMPTPEAGSAELSIINARDKTYTAAVAPCRVDTSPGDYVRLWLNTDAIDSGYLGTLDPTWVDEVSIRGGAVTSDHLGELGRLAWLRRLEVFPTVDVSSIDSDDLLALKDLPQLRVLQPGVPLPEGAFPHVLGNSWISPGLVAARAAAGLPELPNADTTGSPVRPTCIAQRRPDGCIELTVHLDVHDGWYLYPPGSPAGVPVSIALSTHEFVEPLAPESDEPRLQGQARLAAVLAGHRDHIRLDLTIQACDGTVCLAPTTTSLVVPVPLNS